MSPVLLDLKVHRAFLVLLERLVLKVCQVILEAAASLANGAIRVRWALLDHQALLACLDPKATKANKDLTVNLYVHTTVGSGKGYSTQVFILNV